MRLKRKFKNKHSSYIHVSGLNFVNALHCPHYDIEKERQGELKKTMRKNRGIAIALENCAAIEIIDDQYQIITSKQNVNAYKIYWYKNKFYKIKLKKNHFFPLGSLLNKV